MSIIFDVTVSPCGDIYISCCEGMFMCDETLDKKTKFSQIILAGSVAFLSDQRIVAICRNQDTVNFFSKDAIFIKAFKAGFSPMCLVVNSRNELLVSDPGSKCVHVFNTSGELLSTFASSSDAYTLRWPMYLGLFSNDDVVVGDCHAQTVMRFSAKHKHEYTYKMRTHGGNTLLRPHGLTCSQSDLFIVDTTMDTVEVFSRNDSFIQTIIPAEEGTQIKPKCLAMSKQHNLFVVGGRLGVVRVYRVTESIKTESGCENGTPLKDEPFFDAKRVRSKSWSKRKSARDAPKSADAASSRVKRNVFKTQTSSSSSTNTDSNGIATIADVTENQKMELLDFREVVDLDDSPSEEPAASSPLKAETVNLDDSTSDGDVRSESLSLAACDVAADDENSNNSAGSSQTSDDVNGPTNKADIIVLE